MSNKVFPLIILIAAMMLMIESSSRPHYGSTVSFPPEAPRLRITSIPNDANVNRLRVFATAHKLEWEITPDLLDGTDYCSTLRDPKSYESRYSCADNVAKSINEVMTEWNLRDVKVGSSE